MKHEVLPYTPDRLGSFDREWLLHERRGRRIRLCRTPCGRAGSIYLGKYYNDEIVHRLMEDELSVFMTDAWVEEKGLQNIAAFQTFPQFFLLAKRYGIPVEKIVRKMTGATADRYRIPERGYLRPGYKADLTVVDLENLRVNEKQPDFKPGGIVHVYVNGHPVLENGSFLGGCAGEVVLKPQ